MVNKAEILGHAGSDPRVHVFDNGGKVVTVNVATTEKYKNKKTGQQVSDTEWHTVKFYDSLASIVEQYVQKGTLVYVSGKMKTETYEKDGQEVAVKVIVARDLKLVSGPDSTRAEKPKLEKSPAVVEAQVIDDDEQGDELPF